MSALALCGAFGLAGCGKSDAPSGTYDKGRAYVANLTDDALHADVLEDAPWESVEPLLAFAAQQPGRLDRLAEAAQDSNHSVARYVGGLIALGRGDPETALALFENIPADEIPPPTGLMAEQLPNRSYRLRLVGQSPAIDVVWYGPIRHGRHHTLNVCMQFRGVEILPEASCPGVDQSDRLWLREFFVQRGRLLDSYRAYLFHTFLPLSCPGAHIVMSAPKSVLSAEDFGRESYGLAERIGAMALWEETGR
jgi:hypothetical protein